MKGKKPMTGRRYGGFWRRLFAFLIDQIILYFISLILFLIALLALGLRGDKMGRMLASADDLMQGMGSMALCYMVASLLAGGTYFTWFHGMAGRTPGKMLLGLRVIQASGDPITPGLAFLRWVGYLISGPLFFLGFLWIAFDGRKQGWHDKIAATLVIKDGGGSGHRVADETPTDTGMQPSAAEPDAFVPIPEEMQEKPRTDELSPAT
jgi:uncharacterized RDD family membrane protein YckC